MSIVTPSTSRSSCAATRSCAASRLLSREAARARWSPPPAMRQGATAWARRCPRRGPGGCARRRCATAGLPHLQGGLAAGHGPRSRACGAGRGSGARRGLPGPGRAVTRRARRCAGWSRRSGRPLSWSARWASARTSSSRRSPPTRRSRRGSSCSRASRRACASREPSRGWCPASDRRPPRAWPRWG